MRDHEISLILTWIGYKTTAAVTERMLMDAIKYAYDIGYTDGSGPPLTVEPNLDTITQVQS